VKTEFVEHKSKSYAPRTYHNASVGDLTLAIAVDYNTAGEKLTKKASEGKYLPIWYHTDSLLASREIYKWCKKLNVKTLNIAGNGVYTFQEQNIDQKDINYKLYEMISLVHKYYPIEKIVSGGQTGMDLAGGVVAEVLGIPCTMTYPKGFKIRGFDGIDVEIPIGQLKADFIGFVEHLKQQITD